jgi:hypothetical protein
MSILKSAAVVQSIARCPLGMYYKRLFLLIYLIFFATAPDGR